MFPLPNPQEGGNVPRTVRKGETCPTGLGRGKHALGRLVGSGKVSRQN